MQLLLALPRVKHQHVCHDADLLELYVKMLALPGLTLMQNAASVQRCDGGWMAIGGLPWVI